MANLAGRVVVGAVHGAAAVVALALLWAVRHATASAEAVGAAAGGPAR